MAEQIPEMEKIAEADSLRHEVAEARVKIEQDMGDPAQQTADAVGEVGLVKSLWNVIQKHNATARELTWKDLKAMGMGALSVIPVLGEAGTAANIGRAVTAGKNVAKVEKATWIGIMPAEMLVKRKVGKGISVALKTSRGDLWKEFGRKLMSIPENPVNRYLRNPLSSSLEAGKATVDFTRKAMKSNSMREIKAARGLAAKRAVEAGKNIGLVAGHSILHRLDPFPDVPPALVTVAGFTEFVLPGANILPAVWQIAHNKIEWAKMYGGLALDMGKVVMKRFDGKMNEAKKPDVMAASGAFV